MAGARRVLWEGPGGCCGRGQEGAVAGARRRLWFIVEHGGKPLRVHREDGGCPRTSSWVGEWSVLMYYVH